MVLYFYLITFCLPSSVRHTHHSKPKTPVHIFFILFHEFLLLLTRTSRVYSNALSCHPLISLLCHLQDHSYMPSPLLLPLFRFCCCFNCLLTILHLTDFLENLLRHTECWCKVTCGHSTLQLVKQLVGSSCLLQMSTSNRHLPVNCCYGHSRACLLGNTL